MGNSLPRYYEEKESRDIIGHVTYERLASQLQILGDGDGLDFDIFSRVLAAHFNAMVMLNTFLYYVL